MLHPGPMNRGVEIDSSVADGRQSVILPQVTFGIAIRMAVMSILAGNQGMMSGVMSKVEDEVDRIYRIAHRRADR